MIWQRVTANNPCPICQKSDWCQFGDRAMKCMRVASDHVCASGGWYHFYDEKVRPDFVPRIEKESPRIDAFGLMRKWWSETMLIHFQNTAKRLGLVSTSLSMLGAAFAREYNAWAFPMRDGSGNIIGIRLRNDQGFKWAVRGSRQGVFVPNESFEPLPLAYLPEGPTDAAAAITLGLFPIARPTCLTGNEYVKATMKRLGIYMAVIIADRDDIKQIGNRSGRPGIEGAQKLKRELGFKSVIWTPPAPLKDLREFLRAGGTREMIESDIKNQRWTTK